MSSTLYELCQTIKPFRSQQFIEGKSTHLKKPRPDRSVVEASAGVAVQQTGFKDWLDPSNDGVDFDRDYED